MQSQVDDFHPLPGQKDGVIFLQVWHQLLEHKQRLENDSLGMKKNEGYHKTTQI